MMLMKIDEVVTAVGNSNIALIKYWGKRNRKLILPTNSSLSITLDENVSTRTSVMFSKKLKEDTFYIDGELKDMSDSDTQERFAIIDQLRNMAGVKERILMVSKNNFPASAGMASSASGSSTLAFAAANALGLKMDARELSKIARQGSGSSCRSLMGGFVKWNKGEKTDGSDSYAEQVFDERHWPEAVSYTHLTLPTTERV